MLKRFEGVTLPMSILSDRIGNCRNEECYNVDNKGYEAHHKRVPHLCSDVNHSITAPKKNRMTFRIHAMQDIRILLRLNEGVDITKKVSNCIVDMEVASWQDLSKF